MKDAEPYEVTAQFLQCGMTIKRRWTFRLRHKAEAHVRAIKRHREYITSTMSRIP